MSAYEEAKAEAKEHYCVDYYADNCDECKRTEALIQAADKEIATKDAELARLREDIKETASELGKHHYVYGKLMNALKSHDS